MEPTSTYLIELYCRWFVKIKYCCEFFVALALIIEGTVNCSLISLCLQVSSESITALGSSTQINLWTMRKWPVMCSGCRPIPSTSSSPTYAFPPKVRTTLKHIFSRILFGKILQLYSEVNDRYKILKKSTYGIEYDHTFQKKF